MYEFFLPFVFLLILFQALERKQIFYGAVSNRKTVLLWNFEFVIFTIKLRRKDPVFRAEPLKTRSIYNQLCSFLALNYVNDSNYIFKPESKLSTLE